MADYVIQITNVSSSLQYKLRLKFAQEYRPKTNKSTTAISPPNTNPENARLLQFQGMSMNFKIQATLYDDGTDISDGTAPQDGSFADTDGDGTEDVITIEEQVRWINFYIHRQGIGVGWILTGSGLPSGGVNCSIDDASATLIADRPHEAECQFSLTAGSVQG